MSAYFKLNSSSPIKNFPKRAHEQRLVHNILVLLQKHCGLKTWGYEQFPKSAKKNFIYCRRKCRGFVYLWQAVKCVEGLGGF